MRILCIENKIRKYVAKMPKFFEIYIHRYDLSKEFTQVGTSQKDQGDEKECDNRTQGNHFFGLLGMYE